MYHQLFLFFLIIGTSIKAVPEKKIIIVIPSYNNPLHITRACLESALNQNYSNFEILFCDDCSPQPDIEQRHRELIKELDKHNKITYKRNKNRYGPIGNQWLAWHSINPDNILDNRDIIVANLDGDDLLEPDALAIVNELHEKAWVTWGQFDLYPSHDAHNDCCDISESIIAANEWRKVPGGLATSHLRTARLSLLKELPMEALLYKGNFYPAAGDAPLMWSLCEKAGFHTAYNPRIVYHYRQTDQCESKIYAQLSAECAQFARQQKPFAPLNELTAQTPASFFKTDLIIFSYNRPMQLYALLESIQQHITGLNTTTILYRADTDYEQAYQEVIKAFDRSTFIKQAKKLSRYC